MSNKTARNLYQLQSLMAAAIMRPLINDGMQDQWSDSINTGEYAAQFIKPNKRLTSFERLEIYNKQYWYRLLESLQDDFPGLNAILGHKRFEKLAVAYLSQYPSRSYTLNDLGKNLPDFIKQEESICLPDAELAYDMACFEWAEIKASDSQVKSILKVEDLQKIKSAEIILQTQPYLSVLELRYEVDNFLLALNKEHTKSVESNAVSSRTVKFSQSSSVKKRRNYVAIHRLNNIVYYKRLDRDQYLLLNSLMKRKTLAQACNELISRNNKMEAQEKLALKINKSFTTWMELGWFVN